MLTQPVTEVFSTSCTWLGQVANKNASGSVRLWMNLLCGLTKATMHYSNDGLGWDFRQKLNLLTILGEVNNNKKLAIIDSNPWSNDR